MKEELVSAIITTHNRSPYIVLRAVKSVLKQTYKNIEVIVVDDSTASFSQRNEVERVIREQSNRIIYIRHEKNMGSCAARNTGLLYANGFYVAYLDDDDEWLPEKIEKQIEGFCNSNIALVYCGYNVIDEKRGKRYVNPTIILNGFVFEELLTHKFNGVTTSNPLIKKECINSIGGFDTEMQSLQDYDLMLRITMKYPVNCVKEPLLNYYIHDGNRISNDIDKRIAGRERILEKYRDIINSDDLAWYMNYKELVLNYLQKDGRKKAFYMWIKCVRKSPLFIINNLKLLIQIVLTRNIKELLRNLLGMRKCRMLFRRA